MPLLRKKNNKKKPKNQKIILSKSLEIIITSNESNSEHDNIIMNYLQENKIKNTKYIPLSLNAGYFGGANLAIKMLNINPAQTKYCIIANNDIIIKDPLFFEKLQKNRYLINIIKRY